MQCQVVSLLQTADRRHAVRMLENRLIVKNRRRKVLRRLPIAVFAVALFTFAGCSTGSSGGPTAPSSANLLAAVPSNSAGPVSSTAPATSSRGVVGVSATAGGDRHTVIGFPPRNEPNAFFQNLIALYRDVLRRPQTSITYVDAEGENVWLTEYFRLYLNGCSHQEAVSRTISQIRSGGSQAVCGGETPTFPPRNLPNEFQAQLEATYRDVLRRPLILSYVDSEGANVWLAQYLRFRVGGCTHAEAESKVFTEIRGGGVQPICAPLWSVSGSGNSGVIVPSGVSRVRVVATWVGSPTGWTDFSIVNANSQIMLRVYLGGSSSTSPFGSQRSLDGAYTIASGSYRIMFAQDVAWSITELR